MPESDCVNLNQTSIDRSGDNTIACFVKGYQFNSFDVSNRFLGLIGLALMRLGAALIGAALLTYGSSDIRFSVTSE